MQQPELEIAAQPLAVEVPTGHISSDGASVELPRIQKAPSENRADPPVAQMKKRVEPIDAPFDEQQNERKGPIDTLQRSRKACVEWRRVRVAPISLVIRPVWRLPTALLPCAHKVQRSHRPLNILDTFRDNESVDLCRINWPTHC